MFSIKFYRKISKKSMAIQWLFEKKKSQVEKKLIVPRELQISLKRDNNKLKEFINLFQESEASFKCPS